LDLYALTNFENTIQTIFLKTSAIKYTMILLQNILKVIDHIPFL